MKRSLMSMLIALITIITPLSLAAQTYKSMPENARNYVKKHFKDYTISHYEKDSDLLNVEYKVYVTKNRTTFKLDFDKSGNVKDIESVDDRTPLPPSVLPVKITQYVKKAFPGTKILEWKKKRNSQVIELSNDMELVFNAKGDFIRIDE